MEDVRTPERLGPPAVVGIAALVGFAKAIFEIGFGVLGIAVAKGMDDSFGGGILVFGIVYAIVSFLLWRGSRAGYYLTILLSALGLVVAIVYAFRADSAVLSATIVSAFWNGLVLYLLLGTKNARRYFAR